jgi:hypothetical protein
MFVLSVAQLVYGAGDENGFWNACVNQLISCTEDLPQCAAYYCAGENHCLPSPQASWTLNGSGQRVGFDLNSYSCDQYDPDYVDCMDMAEGATPAYCFY